MDKIFKYKNYQLNLYLQKNNLLSSILPLILFRIVGSVIFIIVPQFLIVFIIVNTASYKECTVRQILWSSPTLKK